MNKELMHAIGESMIRLRFLVGTQFLKPIREIERERNELTPGHIHIMRWLMTKENTPASMTDLSAAACISKPNLTTMIDKLCLEGLAERSADVNDRRIVNVSLTQKGIDLLHQHKAEVMVFVESRLSLLDDAELEKLKQALEDIVDIIKIIGEKKEIHK